MAGVRRRAPRQDDAGKIAKTDDRRDQADACYGAPHVGDRHPLADPRNRVREVIAVPEHRPRGDGEDKTGFNEVRGDEQAECESNKVLVAFSREWYQTVMAA